MDVLRATLDSTDGQVATVSRTSSPPPVDLANPPPPIVAEYWCHTQIRVAKIRYIWTISNFSFSREEIGDVVKSSFFSCGPNDKLRWCLRINPKGLDEESREYLSLYLLLVNCGTKSDARAKFKFSILNAKREETKAMESQRAYRFVQGKDWGFKKFIRRDVLMDEANGLLPNDRLTILCEVSVVGETLCESGQINNQPITIPQCNLHEDIGNLLFKQLLTDVTLVVVSNNSLTKCSSDCNQPHIHQYSDKFSLNSTHHHQPTTGKYVAVYDDDDDDDDNDEIEDQVDDVDDEHHHEVEDDEDDDEDRDNFDEHETPLHEDEHESDSSYRDALAKDDNGSHGGSGSAGGSSGDDRVRLIMNSEAEVGLTTLIAQSQQSGYLLSSSTQSPATTTDVGMAKGLAVVNSLALGLDSSSNEHQQTDWRFSSTPSSSSYSSVNSLQKTNSFDSQQQQQLKSDVACCDGLCDGNWSLVKNVSNRCRISNSTPSTSSALPSTTESCGSVKAKQFLGSNSDVVGSSSSATTNLSMTNESQPKNGHKSIPTNGLQMVYCAKKKTEESIEAEPSGTLRHPRRGNGRRSNNNTNSHRRSQTVNPDGFHSKPTVTKAASTTSYSNVPGGFVNQTVKSSSMRVSDSAAASHGSPVVLRQFEAHKAILAARSPVFAAMFEHGMEESRANRVEITDIEPDTVAEVLRFIYTGQVVGLDRLAQDLLAAADKYQLERLKSMCEESLIESLSIDNACDILGLTDMHNAGQLKAHTLEFIMAHAPEVCETEGYERLVRYRPRLLNECFRSLASQQLPLRCWARKRPRQS